MPVIDPDPSDGVKYLLHNWHKVGIWPTNNGFLYYILGFIVQFFFTIIFNFSQLMNLFTITNVAQSTEILFTSITELAMLVKLIITIFSNSAILNLLDVMKQTLKLDTDKQEERIKAMEGIKRSQTLYRILLYGYLSSAVTAALACLFSKEISLPLPSWYPYDWENEKFYYWLSYTYQISSIIIHSPILSGIDTIPSCLMCVVSGYYEALGVTLTNIGWNETGTTKEIEKQRRIAIKKCVLKHIHLKNIIVKIENTFSSTIFIQFCVGGFVICMTVFQMSLMPFRIYYHKYIFMVTYLVAMSAAIFMPCYFGNELMLKNSKILRDMYEANWIDFSKTLKKDVIIFMQGTHYQNKIRAGGLFDASLVTFTSIANFTFSLYALLTNIHDK